jgi:hypothetical protein
MSSIEKDFEEILDYAHMWNWVPDWVVVQNVYHHFPESYSVLTPFAYTYLEEMIRTTTPEYGAPLYDRSGIQVSVKRGAALIDLAIRENKENAEYVKLLQQMKSYYKPTPGDPTTNNRNQVLHGHLHPKFWSKENFELLIHDIATLSKYSKF